MKQLKMSEAKYFVGMKVRIYPSSKQKQIIKKNSDLSRFIYNKYVALNKEKSKLQNEIKEGNLTNNEKLSNENRIKEINSFNFNPTNLEKSIDWMENDKEIDPQTKYLALKSYKSAWNMWRKVKKSKPPTFKKKSYVWSYSTSECKILDRNHIKINKIGRIRVKKIRKRFLHDKLAIGKTTIIKDNDNKFYLSVQLGSLIPFFDKVEETGTMIGIDLNTSNFLTTSDNEIVENPRFHEKALIRLKKKQRKFSRKIESAKREKRKHIDSKLLQKARLELAKEHKKVTNQRKDFLNRTVNELIKNHDFIFVEDLKVSNMMKNNRLARSIADVSWGSFLELLETKANQNDKMFIKVDPRHTTQTCSNCDYIMSGKEKIQLGVKEWVCPNCKVHHSRDHNAAINIRNKGMKLLFN